MSEISRRAGAVVDRWPSGGLAVAVLPDPADPSRSGRTAVDLVEAVAERRKLTVVVDLAPAASDLATRLDADLAPGLADVESGEIPMWEAMHRDIESGAFYLPRGARRSAGELVDSASLKALGDRVRRRGGVLLVILDRATTAAVDSAGWMDGHVRLGEGPQDAADSDDELPDLGRLVIEPPSHQEGADERTRSGPGGVPHDPLPEPEADAPGRAESPRVVFPHEPATSRPWSHRVAAGLAVAAVLALAALGASAVLGGSEWGLPGGLTGGAEGRGGEFTDSPVPGSEGAAVGSVASSPDPDVRASRGAEETASPAPALSRPVPDPGVARPLDARVFEAASDSLRRRIRNYHGRAERFRNGALGCAAVSEAYERADRLFVRLSVHRVSLGSVLDSAALVAYRNRAEDMEDVESSFRETGCPRP